MEFSVIPAFREYLIRIVNPPADKRADFWPIWFTKENPIQEWEMYYKDQAGKVRAVQIDVVANYEK
jgi:hypothetical protein